MKDRRPLLELLARLRAVRRSCLETERSHADMLDQLARAEADAPQAGAPGPMAGAAASARNLLHYLALRSDDLRDLHEPLAAHGLSSLGRAEAHVLANLDGVIAALECLTRTPEEAEGGVAPVSLRDGREILERRAQSLLGASRAPGDSGAGVRIMVTLPGEAAEDAGLVRRMLDAGMTCARINTAHDGPRAWERMCRLVRAESARAGVACRILMDLAGPKIRTGPIEPGPRVLRIKPGRDALGQVVSPGEVILRAAHDAPGEEPRALPVDGDWLHALRTGDVIELRDARGRRRTLAVEVSPTRAGEARGVVRARTTRTIYVRTGTVLRLRTPDGREPRATVGPLPPTQQAIVVRPGDPLVVSFDAPAGRPASDGGAAVITCTLPQAFARCRPGGQVWFDDGRVGAVIVHVGVGCLELRVTTAARDGSKIRADKGINLPDTDIPVRGLTPEDVEVLPLAAAHADMIGLSFVREPADVDDVRARLRDLGAPGVGVVLKIETSHAFERLPALLLAALHAPAAGVMIARGDLAVEVGYDRLAEVQEEILWLCEAAHVPVIWATQVLESMAKEGRPSRAEVTDAAMGERAECVMLNKGPFIVEAIELLGTVMRRMLDHQAKKRSVMRALAVARRFSGRA
ncbi:MAG: pyruvate kinase [Planctomycetota bacterium]|nr:pyruvate kinase [Planctomycetota bacterium]